MKLLISLIISFAAIVSFPQDDKTKNPEVELPDFVITGRSQLNIKKIDKIKPDFISSSSSLSRFSAIFTYCSFTSIPI